MAKKVLIVGGVAAGASAAARLRRLDESATILLFEKDSYISFANCGLPYHIGGTIPQRDALIVQTPETMRARFRIDARIHSEVTAVNTAAKTVHVREKSGAEYEESYDTLVLAPGASPIVLPTENDARSFVFSLRNIEDMDKIKLHTDGLKKNARAVVIGGGFIGLEMAAIAQKELEKHGVTLSLGVGVENIAAQHGKAIVRLQGGTGIEADIVISAVGVRPATGFLQNSGIALGPKGHILTDAYLRTNIADVYAAGDAIQVTDYITSQPTAVPLAGPANRQGRLVADNIAGLSHAYRGAQGSAIIKLFDITAANTGTNERTLQRLGLAYQTIYAHPYGHAGYYPGAEQFSIKLLFHPEGKIYGAQIVGGAGVDKRIDVLATAIRLNAHVTDLADLELAYAPPYSSAKDPVNMLGYIAQNMIEGVTEFITWEEALRTFDPEKITLLDVRTPEEFARGHMKGAINIPVDTLRERLGELDRDKPIYEYCQVGIRAHTAHRILLQNGFRARSITGGHLSRP